MTEKLKFCLNVEDVNHRVFVKVPAAVNCASFDDLKQTISRYYENLVQYLDSNHYVFEVYDNDFKEYVQIDEKESLENCSKLRVKCIKKIKTKSDAIKSTVEVNVSSKKTSRNHQNHENVDELVNLNGVTKNLTLNASSKSQSANGAKPDTAYQSTTNNPIDFSNEFKLSNEVSDSFLKVNPFFKQLAKQTAEVTDLTAESDNDDNGDSHSDHSSVSSEGVKNPEHNVEGGAFEESLSPDDRVLKIIGKKKILLSNFKLNEPDKKIALATVVRTMGKKFKNKANDMNVWNKVSKKLAKKGIIYAPKKCNGYFMGLFGQYLNILNNLQEYTQEDASQLWPLFTLFHCSMNLKPFKSNINSMREAFDNHPKNCELDVELFPNDSSGSSDERQSTELTRSHVNYPENASNDEEEINADLAILVRLVQSVAENIDYLKESKLAEEDFWQTIAYEMASYACPMEEDVKSRWKVTFYSLLRDHLWSEPLSLGSSASIKSLFEKMDIGVFMNTSDKEMSDLLAKSHVPSFEGINFSSVEEIDEELEEKWNCQQMFLTWVRKCIKVVVNNRDEETMKKFWTKVRRKLYKKGYNASSDESLAFYFKEFIKVYFKALETCSSCEEAINRWPMFEHVHKIDLAPFIDDCEYYRMLKDKFE